MEVGASGSGGTSGTTAIPCVATDTASVGEERDFLEDCSRSVHVGSGFIKFNNVVTSKCWQVSAYGPNQNASLNLLMFPHLTKLFWGKCYMLRGPIRGQARNSEPLGEEARGAFGCACRSVGQNRRAARALERTAPH